MPVSIGMSVTETSVDTANNRSYVNVVVTAYYNGGSFNRNDPPLTVTLDGVSETVNVDFNAGEATSGSEVIYSQTWYVGHDSDGSKTLYYSASYVTGVSSGTVSTSGSLVLTKISTDSGGDSGGDSGDEDTDTYYDVIFSGSNAKISVSASSTAGDYPSYKAGSTITISVSASDGYTLTSCYIDGESTTYASVTVTGDIYVTATAEPIEYALSVSAGTGSTVTVTRNGTTLSVNNPIYYNDKLTITFGAETGYSLATHTVNGSEFTSGSSHTVTGNVTIIATATATVTLTGTAHIDGVEYTVCIEDGTNWNEYEAYIDNGTSWDRY